MYRSGAGSDPRWFGTLVTAGGERRTIESLARRLRVAYYEAFAAAILDGALLPVRAPRRRAM